MNWKTEFARLDDDRKFETINGLWTGKKPPFVTAGVIRNTNFTECGRIDYSDVALLEVEHRQLMKRKLLPGDIIVERSGGGPKQPVGKVVYFDREDGSFSFSNFTSAIRVRNREAFDAKFIFYVLMEMYRSGKTEDIQRRTTGLRNLDFTAYKERATFPQILLSEQQTITRLLGLVQRALEQEDRLIELTVELKKSLRQKLFREGVQREIQKKTEIGLLPSGWGVVKLGDECGLSTGTTPATSRKDYYVGDISFVKTADITNNRITNVGTFISKQAVLDYRLKLYPAGTILMAMYGQGKTRGQVGLLEVTAATTQNAGAIQPSANFDSEFLWQWLMSRYEQLRGTGALGHISHLNLGYLRDILIPKPPLADQRDIATVLRDVDKKIALTHQKRSALHDLFHTMLHQLMTAQIRVRDLDLQELESALAA